MKTDIIKQFNLPSYVKGKSFSDASKAIQNKFKDREDSVSKETMMDLLNRLKQAQEYIKSESDMTSQNQYNFGGNMGGMGNMFGGIGDKLKKNPDETIIAGDPDDNAAVDGVKDGVATALGPWGQLFRGIQKAGQGLGDAVGGDVGAGVADAFSPEESTIAMWKDKDASTLEKIGGTVPILGGVLAKRAKQDKIQKQQIDNLHGNYNYRMNDYAKGGYTNNYSGLDIFPNYLTYLNNGIDTSKLTNTSDDYHTGDPSLDYKTSQPSPNKLSYDINASIFGADEYTKKIKPIDGSKRSDPNIFSDNTFKQPNVGKTSRMTTKADLALQKAGDFLKDNYADILRYAPVGMNAYQLAKLKKPGRVNLDRLGNKYERDYVDERALQNSINNSFNDNYLTESSGGSLGRYAANAKAAQLAKMKATSDAYLKANDINRSENKAKQQFDLNVDRFNVGQSNREQDINDRNLGAYNTEKSKLLGQLGTDIGNIGKEEKYKQMVKDSGLCYDSRGNYICDDEDTNQSKYGGNLDSNSLFSTYLDTLIKKKK